MTTVLLPRSQSLICPFTPARNKREVNPLLSCSVDERLYLQSHTAKFCKCSNHRYDPVGSLVWLAELFIGRIAAFFFFLLSWSSSCNCRHSCYCCSDFCGCHCTQIEISDRRKSLRLKIALTYLFLLHKHYILCADCVNKACTQENC